MYGNITAMVYNQIIVCPYIVRLKETDKDKDNSETKRQSNG